MSGQTCALEGCGKACTAAEHLACGELHHLLLMAGRYNPLPAPHPYHSILLRNAEGHCALPSCSKPPWPGHSWCSRTHYLSWLSSFYASLSPLQICKLPGCTRHVFVSDSDDKPPWEFCGWRHRQKFAMLSGIQQQHHCQSSSMEKEPDHVDGLKSVMHEFKHFALHGTPTKTIRVDDEFFSKHPWEVLSERKACYLIARCKFTRRKKQRDMVTKDHYHWKQQGPPTEKSGYCKKYFTYRKLKGKKGKAVQFQDENTYTMKEYVMDGVELYSFVKVYRGGKKLCRRGKLHKQRSGLGCSQGSVTSNVELPQLIENWDELFQVDGFHEDWSCITVLR